jgi:hypothetical protein
MADYPLKKLNKLNKVDKYIEKISTTKNCSRKKEKT